MLRDPESVVTKTFDRPCHGGRLGERDGRCRTARHGRQVEYGKRNHVGCTLKPRANNRAQFLGVPAERRTLFVSSTVSLRCGEAVQLLRWSRTEYQFERRLATAGVGVANANRVADLE